MDENQIGSADGRTLPTCIEHMSYKQMTRHLNPVTDRSLLLRRKMNTILSHHQRAVTNKHCHCHLLRNKLYSFKRRLVPYFPFEMFNEKLHKKMYVDLRILE